MFTPPLSRTFLILGALFSGLVVGALIGLSACLLLRLKIRARDIIVDSILGALGFEITWEIVFLIPWRNTVTYHAGNTLVSSTMDHYQHPDVLLTLLPCFFLSCMSFADLGSSALGFLPANLFPIKVSRYS